MSAAAVTIESLLARRFGLAPPDLEKASAYQRKYGGAIEQILVNMGSLSADTLPVLYAELLGLRVLETKEIEPEWKPPAEAQSLPSALLVGRGWMPLRHDERGWTFATRAPLDLEAQEMLGKERCAEVLVASNETFDYLRTLSRVGDSAVAGLSLDEETRLKELASEAPTVNLLNGLIAKALRMGASDMHLEPHKDRARVRFRIDGVLHEVDWIPRSLALPVVTRLKILAGMDIAEKRRPQDGKIDLKIATQDLDIRVSTLPLPAGESVVMRFLRKETLSYDIVTLGIAADTQKLILEDIEKTTGVILVTGPTGSGKTTSLYSFLSRLNGKDVKIITLEDPVEYQIAGINQVQVQPDIGFTFANGLRAIVRQDPDIIMVGEIRDGETAGVAMQSALTGHLVFSTVHTNDAASAYTRLLDLGVEEFLLNAALVSIMAQRLARRACAQCAAPHPEAARLMHDHALGPIAERFGVRQPRLLAAHGCDACNHTGYQGRVALVEYLRCDDRIKSLPKGAQFLTEARAHCRAQGWRSLVEDGLLKALNGETTVEEVMRVAG